MMRIVLLNGEPTVGSEFDRYVDALAAQLALGDHQVERLDLRELSIRRCRGCRDCWVRTPGECTSRDGSPIVCREVIAADVVLFASPMVMGFPTELLKRATDKLVPLLHPYTRIVEGETAWRHRYDRYPLFALLLGESADADDMDVQIVSDVWGRMAAKFHTRLVLTARTSSDPGEVADALAHR